MIQNEQKSIQKTKDYSPVYIFLLYLFKLLHLEDVILRFFYR